MNDGPEADAQPFVPEDFGVPTILSIDLDGRPLQLEPLGPEHNERDHAAWMGSSEFIHTLPGFRPGERTWPVPMTLEENLGDVVEHVDHFQNRVGFTWSVLIGDEVVGCLYVYPPSDERRAAGHDAEVRSWVTERQGDFDPVFRRWVVDWLAAAWPFTSVYYQTG